MIHEAVMAQGSFDIPLTVDTPWPLLSVVDDFGHIVITDQWLETGLFSDAAILSVARYSGVVLGVVYTDGKAQIRGAGMVWWLGNESDVGPIIEAKQSMSGATLDTCLTNLLPSAITKGSVSEPASAVTYTGQHQWETPLSAIRTVSAALGTEFRVNPDGTLDAADSNVLFNIDSPTVVVMRDGWGSDPTYQGVPSDLIQSTRDARTYVTQVILLQDDLDGTFTNKGSDSRATTYKDIHGNAMTRTFLTVDNSVDATAVTTFLATELSEWVVEDLQDVDTSQVHSDATFAVGDSFYVWDPPVMVDLTNQITFRGDIIHPKKLRLLEASWPLTDGMGVYYRDKDGTYTDLSRFVAWEK